MKLKNNFRKLYVKIFSRKINGLLIGGKVKIENKGTIKSGNNSYLGAIDNHTVKMVWNGKEAFLDYYNNDELHMMQVENQMEELDGNSDVRLKGVI